MVAQQLGRPYPYTQSARARGEARAADAAPPDASNTPADGSRRVRTRMGVGTPPAGGSASSSRAATQPATSKKSGVDAVSITGLDTAATDATDPARTDEGPMALVERFMRERSVFTVQMPFDGPAGKGVLSLYYEVESAYRITQLVPAASLVDAQG